MKIKLRFKLCSVYLLILQLIVSGWFRWSSFLKLVWVIKTFLFDFFKLIISFTEVLIRLGYGRNQTTLPLNQDLQTLHQFVSLSAFKTNLLVLSNRKTNPKSSSPEFIPVVWCELREPKSYAGQTETLSPPSRISGANPRVNWDFVLLAY